MLQENQRQLADLEIILEQVPATSVWIDSKKIRFYTGFVTYTMSMACFNFLLASVADMRTWQGKRTSSGERTTEKTGKQSKIISTCRVLFQYSICVFCFP